MNDMIRQLAIKVSDSELPITSLSGGNQQKVVLGKALMTGPQVVLLDEPTRGIDVGAKTDVYHLIGQLAQQGLAVMFSSSELDEVMALADRILGKRRIQTVLTFRQREARPSMAADRGPGSPASPVYDR